MKKYNIDEVLADQNEFYYKLIDKIKFKIRSAAIGIIKEFDSAKYNIQDCKNIALSFSKEIFIEKIKQALLD